ncbi:MAG: hypothetical protein ACO273_11860, partial [Burkholderiales bacterium]
GAGFQHVIDGVSEGFKPLCRQPGHRRILEKTFMFMAKAGVAIAANTIIRYRGFMMVWISRLSEIRLPCDLGAAGFDP